MRQSDLTAYQTAKALGEWKKERNGKLPSLEELKAKFPESQEPEALLECYKAIGGSRAVV